MPRTARLLKITLVAASFVLLLAAVACGGKSTGTTGDTSTAKGALAAAESAVATAAPDAKLLLVQTGTPTQPGAAPVWSYVFGSPKSGQMYSVSVAGGKAMGATEIGAAPLSEGEWASIPKAGSWKIDSDAAYQKALEASGAKGDPVSYWMLLNTYVPQSSTSKPPAEAMMWYVSFEPGASGATDKVIKVDAQTGATSVE